MTESTPSDMTPKQPLPAKKLIAAIAGVAVVGALLVGGYALLTGGGGSAGNSTGAPPPARQEQPVPTATETNPPVSPLEAEKDEAEEFAVEQKKVRSAIKVEHVIRPHAECEAPPAWAAPGIQSVAEIPAAIEKGKEALAEGAPLEYFAVSGCWVTDAILKNEVVPAIMAASKGTKVGISLSLTSTSVTDLSSLKSLKILSLYLFGNANVDLFTIDRQQEINYLSISAMPAGTTLDGLLTSSVAGEVGDTVTVGDTQSRIRSDEGRIDASRLVDETRVPVRDMQ